MWIHVGTLMYISEEAHEQILASQYKGPVSEATGPFEHPLHLIN